MNDDILDGLEDVLEGINAEVPGPVGLPAMKKPRAKKAAAPAPAKAAAPAVAPLRDKSLTHHGFSGERVKIIIERSHDPKEPHSVFLKLNDYTCIISRGQEVEVPVELLGVLNDAVQRSFSQPQDGVLIPHDSIRFPYRVIR